MSSGKNFQEQRERMGDAIRSTLNDPQNAAIFGENAGDKLAQAMGLGPEGAIQRSQDLAGDGGNGNPIISGSAGYSRLTVIDIYTKLTRETAIYPGASEGLMYGAPDPMALAYVALGLAGEAGEIANKVKKVIRDDDGILSEEKAKKIQDELGDVFWYMARLCDELGVDASVVLAENVNKLFSRRDRGVLGGSGDSR